ncbi:MAG: 3-deoxy-manno-octulosonate cytidylyltransferase [Candidatus Omnitrophica bacterium]|nr:3-deoxy-manno-octulosonate cytidylyltransferase [Candidatus Omnitrophota bacterium]
MKAIGIIPSRYGSTRLPAKSLASLSGKPLVQHVYERAKQAKTLDEVIVATDDERILRAVAAFGGKAVMTGAQHRSGTERVAEVARQTAAQVILNIQGDEPLIHPEQIDQIASFLAAHQAVPMATVMTPLTDQADVVNPNVVKVVVDQDGYALYFSRSPIPHARAGAPAYWKHIGLYGYQRYFLLQFPHLPPSPLEQAEQLEQLRALWHGHKIKLLETAHDTIGVVTADDLARVEALLNRHATR